jgi:hypothetical protein
MENFQRESKNYNIKNFSFISINGLFIDAFGSSDYGCRVNNWKGLGRTRQWPNMRYYLDIFPKGRRKKTRKNDRTAEIPVI